MNASLRHFWVSQFALGEWLTSQVRRLKRVWIITKQKKAPKISGKSSYSLFNRRYAHPAAFIWKRHLSIDLISTVLFRSPIPAVGIKSFPSFDWSNMSLWSRDVRGKAHLILELALNLGQFKDCPYIWFFCVSPIYLDLAFCFCFSWIFSDCLAFSFSFSFSFFTASLAALAANSALCFASRPSSSFFSW